MSFRRLLAPLLVLNIFGWVSVRLSSEELPPADALPTNSPFKPFAKSQLYEFVPPPISTGSNVKQADTFGPSYELPTLTAANSDDRQLDPSGSKQSANTNLLHAASHIANDVKYVNDLGDPQRIVFEGASIFQVKQLRNALASDLKYQAAARPSNDIRELLDTIENRLRDGYLNSGCPEARVNAHRDDTQQAIVVHVDEGPRYCRGEVHVHGWPQTDAKFIATWLTTAQSVRRWSCKRGEEAINALPISETNDPVTLWKVGTAVDFRSELTFKLEPAISLALVDMGFAGTEFRLEMIRDAQSKTVQPHIFVLSEPSPSTIGDIEVSGLVRDTREALLHYLRLEPGGRIDAELLARINDQLRDSCRYWKRDLTVVLQPTEETSTKSVTLRLALEEYSEVPPLDEPLTATNEVLRKTAAWIRSLSATPRINDVVCTLVCADLGGKAGAVKLALAANGTIAVDAHFKSVGALDLHHALVIDAENLEVFDWRGNERFGIACHYEPRFNLSITPGSSEAGEQRSSMKLGFTSNSRVIGDASMNVLRGVQAEPVALLRLADLPGTKKRLRDGTLTLASDEFEMEIDEATGAIKSLKAAQFLPLGILAIQFNSERNAAADIVQSIRNRATEFPNRFDADNPLGSMVNFALDQVEMQPAAKNSPSLRKCRLAVTLSQNIIESREFQNLWASWKENCCRQAADNGPAFTFVSEGEGKLDTNATLMYYPVVGADSMFPRESWPWTLAREVCLSKFAGSRGDASSDAFRLRYRNELNRLEVFGPLCLLVLAKVSPKQFAAPGTEMPRILKQRSDIFSDSVFLKEVDLFARGDHGMAVICRATASQLGTLSPEDQQTILELVPEDGRGPLQTLIARRIEMPNEPAGDAISNALLKSWHNGLREVVESRLRGTAIGMAQAPTGAEQKATTK